MKSKLSPTSSTLLLAASSATWKTNSNFHMLDVLLDAPVFINLTSSLLSTHGTILHEWCRVSSVVIHDVGL